MVLKHQDMEHMIPWLTYLKINREELEMVKLREEIKLLRKQNGDHDWNEEINLGYSFTFEEKE